MLKNLHLKTWLLCSGLAAIPLVSANATTGEVQSCDIPAKWVSHGIPDPGGCACRIIVT